MMTIGQVMCLGGGKQIEMKMALSNQSYLRENRVINKGKKFKLIDLILVNYIKILNDFLASQVINIIS